MVKKLETKKVLALFEFFFFLKNVLELKTRFFIWFGDKTAP